MNKKTMYIVLTVIVIAFLGYYLINSSYSVHEYIVTFSPNASDEDISNWAQTNNVTLTKKIGDTDPAIWLIYSPDGYHSPLEGGIAEIVVPNLRIDIY